MTQWQQMITHETFRLLDHTGKATFAEQPYTALTSFALDDTLAEAVSNRLSPPSIRLWTHDNTVVLGIADSRLPYLADGVALLKERGFHAIVRNSGGLAVALDLGVLNISLVLPGVKQITIDQGYEAMVHFVQHMFRDLTDAIEAYEIVGSYCPGKYDLSIDGVKFAGISQRRIRDAAAVQIYLDIEGSGQARAQLIKDFYDVALRGEATQYAYPDVQPRTMGSLTDLLGVPLTVEDVKARVTQTLSALTEEIVDPAFSTAELTTFHRRYEQMLKRNEMMPT